MLTDNVETHFAHPLIDANPLVLIAVFTVLVINILGHVSRTSCGFALNMLRMMVEVAFSGTGKPNAFEEKILKAFPTDIRTARKHFNLESKFTYYASCPACCALYSPEIRKNIPVYPRLCDNKPFPESKPCGARLTKSGTANGKSIRVPIRPFAVQDFDTFVGSLLCRPGVEEMIEAMSCLEAKDLVADIAEGEIVRDIVDTDGLPFVRANAGEARLTWALSVDWYNPYLNKIAGKTASSGSIVLALLLLSPSVRYKAENLYLMGITPGPKEPTVDQINHYLRPLVDKFLHSFHTGTWYSRTIQYPRGRRSRSAIAVEVSDGPGARKVSGHGSHSANLFCMFCHLLKSDINNLDETTWTERTYEEIRLAAAEYQSAKTKDERQTIFKRTGVRGSELMRLPYYTHRRVAIDAMHNLFLGLVQHHFRIVLGVNVPSGDRDAVNADPKQVHRAVQVLDNRPTAAGLKRISVAALKAVIEFRGLSLPTTKGEPKKSILISTLLVSSSNSR